MEAFDGLAIGRLTVLQIVVAALPIYAREVAHVLSVDLRMFKINIKLS